MKTIDFYFDFISPYAYLASCRLPALAEKYGYRVNYIPIDLQAAKLAAGNTGPSSAQIPPKFRYAMIDLMRWANKYDIPFAMIPKKPAGAGEEPPGKVEIPKELLDSSRANKAVYFAREMGQESEFIATVFAGTFGAGTLVGDDNVLRAACEELGWDADSLFRFVHAEEANRAYEEANQVAHARGVFGVPTMIVDGDMWWGNDRLDMLEEYLAR